MGDEKPVPPPALGAFTVREICGFDLLKDAQVLAGEHGMERRVLRLNVMSVPDVARWTKPHELLLTTHYPLARSSDEMVRLLRELDGTGVAALAVKLGGETGLLDADALREADELALPVLTVPDDVAFDDILSEVLAALTNRQAAALRRVQDVHEAMLRLSLGGGGVDDIVRELGRVLGGVGVAFVDRGGSLVADCLEAEHWAYLRRAGVDGDGHGLSRAATMSAHDESRLSGLRAAGVTTGTLNHGYLVVISAGDDLDEEIEMMLQQAAMVAAFNVSKDLAVGAVARRFEAAAIHGLLAGTESEIEEIALRSDAFEWDLDRALVVLAARHESAALEPGDRIRREHDVGAWLSAVRSVDRHAAAGMLGRNLVAICGAAERPADLATDVGDKLLGATRTQFQIGVSGVVAGVQALPTAYRHARMALEFGQQAPGAGPVVAYDSMGLFMLLDAIPDRGKLETFVDETLGPVLALADHERDDMLETMRVLLATRMNIAESSRLLRYHYNTLRYRVRKLEQLLGPFSEDTELELRIAVALNILQMWRISP